MLNEREILPSEPEKRMTYLLLTIFPILFFSCGGGGGGGGSATVINNVINIGEQSYTITSVKISPSEKTISKNSTTQFSASGTTSKGDYDITTAVTWSSSNTNVATINSSSGLATGISEGTATITASLSGQNTTASLTVVAQSTTTGSVPSAPTGVTATAGNGQVGVSWTAVSGATSYKIYLSTTYGVSKISYNSIYTYTPTSSSGTFLKIWEFLTNGTTYYFIVTAVNSYGESGESSQMSATPGSAPSSPSLSSPVTVASEGGQLPKVKKYGNNVYIINTDSSRNLKFYKSADNGASFTTNSTLATNIVNGTEFEFSMDSNGYLYALWEDQTNSQLYIRRSFDSGGSWSSATSVASGFTWIDDPSYYFSGGTMYVLFRGYKNSKIELYLTKSTDNGSSFSTPVPVTNNNIQEDNGGIAIYGSNVYVIYFDAYSASPYNIYLVKSINGGSSFGSPVRVNRTSGKSDFGPTIAVDGSDNVFVAYEDTTSDSEGDLFVAKSTDGGSSFTYTQAADSSYRNQNYPKISIDGSNKIYLLWNDNRDNVSYGSVYYTRSVDGGSTYETNINIRSSGGISNGSLYVYSNTVNIVVTDYNTSPYTTLFYKLMY